MNEIPINNALKSLKIKLENGELPNIIYCYHTINEHSLEALTVNSLWFSSPDRFNDPFDCKVYPGKTPCDYIVEKAKDSSFDGSFMRETFADQLQNGNVDELLQKAIDLTMQKTGIKCFTPFCDNILMWSHYGDSHQGFCLEFDVRKDYEFFCIAHKVMYKKEYPKFDFTDSKNTQFIYGSKFIKWAYEEEIRVFKRPANQLFPYNPQALRSIIFGCKCPDKSIQEVKSILSSKIEFSHVILKKAVCDEHKYSLNITTL